jgi:hypothetical protein
VVGRDLIRNAVTLNTTTVNVARVTGPAIAAVLAATVGIGWCFVVNAASFVFVIASLLSLDPGKLYPVPPVPRRRGQLRAGLRYAAGVPEIARPLLMMAPVAACALAGVASVFFLTTGNATSAAACLAAAGIGHWPARGGQVPDLVPPAR